MFFYSRTTEFTKMLFVQKLKGIAHLKNIIFHKESQKYTLQLARENSNHIKVQIC